jgi:chromosome segregation ATPase
MNPKSIEERVKIGLNACKKDLSTCNINTQESMKDTEKKYSVLQEQLKAVTDQANKKDNEFRLLQKKLEVTILDNNQYAAKSNDLHEELDRAQQRFEQAKKVSLAENERYEQELAALSQRMEAVVTKIDIPNSVLKKSQQTLISQQNDIVTKSVKLKFDEQVKQLDEKFSTSLAENLAIWKQTELDLQRLLEKKSQEYFDEHTKVYTCDQLRTSLDNTVKRQVTEINIIHRALDAIQKERDALVQETSEKRQKIQALEIQNQVYISSHLVETSTLKSRIQTLESMATSKKNDTTSNLTLLQTENDQLKLRVTDLTDEIGLLREHQIEVAKEVKLVESSCPKTECPQIEMQKYTERLMALQAELEILRDERNETQPKLQELRNDLAFQKSQLNTCSQKITASENVTDQNCQRDLLKCRSEIQSMQRIVKII